MEINIISKDHSDKVIFNISSKKIFGSNCTIRNFENVLDFINSSDYSESKVLLIDYHQLRNEPPNVKEKLHTLVDKKAIIYIFDLEEINYLDRNYLLPENFIIRENLNQKTFETVVWRAIKHKLIKSQYSEIFNIAQSKHNDLSE